MFWGLMQIENSHPVGGEDKEAYAEVHDKNSGFMN